MPTRREGREWALQVLFQLDFQPTDPSEALAQFWQSNDSQHEPCAFTEELVCGVMEHLPAVDELIQRYADNWDLRRLGRVDRNVLRLAIFELMHRSDIPPAVSINEAIDLAKYFSSLESGRFVNGVLDRARKELEEASPGDSE